MSSIPAQLVFGEVMHRRLFPVRYRFVYRVFSLLVDVDRAAEAAASSRLFSHNRFNLFSFHDRDHGPRDGTALRPWLQDRLRDLQLDLEIDRIELLCFPRVLGYVFNPLSIWYCYDSGGALRAILCEVSNTFGERHGYLLHRHGERMEWPVHDAHRKEFHVSPFIDMDADYRFRFERREDRLSVVIREYQQDSLMLVAAQKGIARELSDGNLARAALAYPLLTIKIMTMIHWQALKIWLRGARFHSKPLPPTEEVT